MAALLLLFTASLRLWCAVCKLVRTVASAVAELVNIVVACCCWTVVSVSSLVKKFTLRCAMSAAEGAPPELWAKVTVVASRETNRKLENTFFMVWKKLSCQFQRSGRQNGCSRSVKRCKVQFRPDRESLESPLGVHHAAHAVDGFIDLRCVLESDCHRVHASEVHRKLHRRVAIFGPREAPFAA